MKTLSPLLAMAVFMMLTAVPASAQKRSAMTSASGAPQIAPRVVASWYYERVADDMPRLLFLVLYRGQVDWYLREAMLDQHGESGRSTVSADGRIELGPLNVRHVRGGIDLGISVDAAREVMTVLGKELSLAEHNVFLIDRVDGMGGPPEVVGQLSVQLDPALDFLRPDSPDVIGIIRRIPDLQAFVSSP
jgi:hypothetical protein